MGLGSLYGGSIPVKASLIVYEIIPGQVQCPTLLTSIPT